MDDQHNRCSYVCGVHLQRCILKKFHKENDCLCVADRYVQLESENAQLKVDVEQARNTGSYWKNELHEANIEIDRLKAKCDHLQNWYDAAFGTPSEEIRHQQQVEALEAERDQLKAELAQTKQAEQQIREHEFQRGYQEAEEKYRAREARLRECLQKGLGPFVDDPYGFEAWYGEATVLVQETRP